jgi:tetratricopeptide (TPR) repeat protein
MAFVAKNNLSSAEKELKEIEKLRTNKDVEELIIWEINSAGILIKIAYEVLSGEIAAKNKNYVVAIDHLKKAVEQEYTLRYDEPPTWFYPCSQNLGAVLIEAGKYAEAEKVYLKNLEDVPENGWALFGLHQSVLKQNRIDEAGEIQKRFNEAWKNADVTLTSSRIM